MPSTTTVTCSTTSSTTLSTNIHLPPPSLLPILLHNLPSLITSTQPPPISTTADLTYSTATFTHSVKTTHTGKPVTTSHPYALILNVADTSDRSDRNDSSDARDSSDSGDNVFTITFCPSPNAPPNCVQISGTFKLAPVTYTSTPTFTTTQLTLTASIKTSATTTYTNAGAASLLDRFTGLLDVCYERYMQEKLVDDIAIADFVQLLEPANNPIIRRSAYRTPPAAYKSTGGSPQPSPPPSSQNLDLARDALIARMRKHDGPRHKFVRLVGKSSGGFKQGAGSSVAYYERLTETQGGKFGKAVGVMDVGVGVVAGWVFTYMLKERVRDHVVRQGQNMIRTEFLTESVHSKIIVSGQRLPGQIDNRLFIIWLCWRKEDDGSIIVAFDDIKNFPDARIKDRVNSTIFNDADASRCVEASTRGFWKLSPRSENVCDVTLVQQGVLNGMIPTWVMDSRIKQALSLVSKLIDKFERNPDKVDAEMREVFPTPPLASELGEEQRGVFEDCKKLEGWDQERANTDEDGWVQQIGYQISHQISHRMRHSGLHTNDWERIPSPSPFVRMFKKTNRDPAIKRSIAYGKGEVLVDTDSRTALAWWSAFTSRERLRRERAEGNPALSVFAVKTKHDFGVATVKKMPFPLTNREFVGRVIVATDDESGDFLFAFRTDADAKHDYGQRIRSVRGETLAFVRFRSVGDNTCQITHYQYLDAGGNVPASIVNSKLPLSLSGSVVLRAKFADDAKADANLSSRVAEIVRANDQSYSTDELELIHNVRMKMDGYKIESAQKLESPDPRVDMYLSHEKHEAIGHSMTAVHASVAECAAVGIQLTARSHVKEFHTLNGIERNIIAINEHHNVYAVTYDLKVPGFKPRQWVSSFIWKWTSPTRLELVHDSIRDSRFPPNRAWLRVASSGVVIYEALPSINGVPCTRVTKKLLTSLGGFIPRKFADAGAISTMNDSSVLRKQFDKSLEIDKFERHRVMGIIDGEEQVYSAEENAIIDRGSAQFALFANERSKKVKLGSPLTSAKIAHKKGASKTWGWSSTTVRSTAPEVLAYAWSSVNRSEISGIWLERGIDEAPNDHNILLYTVAKLPKPLQPREFLLRNIWKKLDETTFILATEDEESEKRSQTNLPRRAVRGGFPSALRICQMKPDEVKIEYVIKPDIGLVATAVPVYITRIYMVLYLRHTTALHHYFQRLRSEDVCDDQDGMAIGMRLMYPGGRRNAKPHASVDFTFARYTALREMSEKYPWFKVLLHEVLKGKLALNRPVRTKLECVTEDGAKRIGSSLPPALRQRKFAEAGLHQWEVQNPSMIELFVQHGWVRKMLLTISQEILKTAPWGLVWRVTTGSLLSVLDMASDINVVRIYLNTPGQESYAWSLIAMIGTSILLQLVLVYLQNQKKPVQLFKESLVVIVGFKPVLDAYRIVHEGHKDEIFRSHLNQGLAMDRKTELVATRGAEMFAESLPGSVLQMMALLKSLELEKSSSHGSVVASILISAFTCGFTSATISYDYDTDPAKRKLEPAFYGYLPDSGNHRTIMLIAMTCNSCALLLIRSLSTALMILMKFQYFLYWTAADMAFYFTQKMARRDLWYWIPVGNGIGGRLLSVMARILIKSITDYTGIVQFSHPGELGGIYWTVSTLIALSAGFISVGLYYGEVDEGDGVIAQEAMWRIMVNLSCAWIISFLVMLKLMKRKYRKNFLSLKTGGGWCRDYFLLGRSDKDKMGIFGVQRETWKTIREDVVEFILARWWEWEETQPAWFDDDFKVQLSEDMVPVDARAGWRKLFAEAQKD